MTDSTLDRLDKLEAMLTDLFRQLRNVRQRAKEEEQEGQQRDNRLSDLETGLNAIAGLPIRSTHDRVQAQEERLKTLEQRVNRLGFEKAMSEGVYGTNIANHTSTFTHSEYRDGPKRTLKGGWVNVYRDAQGTLLGDCRIYPTKAAADLIGEGGKRVACIQIPDITEGEGL